MQIRLREILFITFLSILAQCVKAQLLPVGKPLEQGHSHNDYYRPWPLMDALELGFKSVEADIFLQDGKLLLAHSKEDLATAKTIQAIYLDRLATHLKDARKLYPKPSEFWIYIDFKTEGVSTYAQLKEDLKKYEKNFIKPFKRKEKGFVRIILTGNYPREIVMQDKSRLVYLDGKLDDLDKNIPKSLIPAVSGNWKSSFKWTGEGNMPAKEALLLKELANKATRTGQKIRFWNLPENNRANLENIWRQLLTYDCFLIGTDRIEWLAEFLETQKK